MTLIELVGQMDRLDREATIYAAEPWTPFSEAIALMEPASAPESELAYFLEVSIARDFLEDWAGTSAVRPTAEEKCDRLIQYAETDA